MGFERFKKREKEDIGYLDPESDDINHLKSHLARLENQASINTLTKDEEEDKALAEQVRARIAELEGKAA